jgi:sugar lactone lactonase YvrE
VRRLVLTASLLLIAAVPAAAGTFERQRIAPELGSDALTRGVARAQVGRDLFANPYATVTLGSVDVYDVFPYVESRTFEIVSDPRWNRLVFGEVGKSLKAYDGAGSAFGALRSPRGMAVDENDRVYVADAGNDRVLVLQAETSQGDIALRPLFAVTGLSGPYDVAYSDGGTPFTTGDDALYVVDTGRNRVVAYALDGAGAREVASIGDLGSGPGRFAGPMAVAVGRSNGTSTHDVFVADAHSRRIVHLRHDASGLRWIGEARHDADVVTSLETDQWGNLYAAAPHQGVVRKFSPDLTPVAELKDPLALSSPRGFHVPFVNVRDHRAGSVTRVGRPNGVSLDAWSDASGMRLWGLGVDVVGLGVVNAGAPSARFTLTDPAELSLEILDAQGGRVRVNRPVGTMVAGVHTVSLSAADLGALSGAGDLVLRLKAVSGYPDAPAAVAETGFRLDGASVGLPTQAVLLGNTPNPVRPYTRIAFVLPANPGDVSLRVFDAQGRTVRQWRDRFAAGRNEVLWDGTDDHGSRLPAGVYFYRLRLGESDAASRDATHKMVLVR